MERRKKREVGGQAYSLSGGEREIDNNFYRFLNRYGMGSELVRGWQFCQNKTVVIL